MKKTYVVRSEEGEYWCGLGKWDKQLRKAQIFTSTQFADRVVYRYKEINPTIVEVRLEIVSETLTNADRIRSMSDEELANMLTDFSNNGGWVTETGREICYERHLEWLKQPAEEE